MLASHCSALGSRPAQIAAAVFALAVLLPGAAQAELSLVDAGTHSITDSIVTSFSPGHSVANYLGAFDIVINPNATLAGNAPALAAFNRAAAQWEAIIADPITVNIDARLASLGPGILGSTAAVTLSADYYSIGSAMYVDSLNEPDDAIVGALPLNPTFKLPAGFSTEPQLNLSLTKANAKALGFTGLDGPFGASDGSIEFSNNFNFDFDNSDGVTPGAFDFETVAAHEIGHLLGFISEVDYVDFVLSLNLTADDVMPTTLDMFRFENGGADDPGAVGEFTTTPRSLEPGVDAVFDQINDSGESDAEVRLSTGLTQGDGRQASHWKDSLGLGIMDPTLFPGELVGIGPNDARALDLIGYEINSVPEARAYLLLSTVACLVGWRAATKRRRRGA